MYDLYFEMNTLSKQFPKTYFFNLHNEIND